MSLPTFSFFWLLSFPFVTLLPFFAYSNLDLEGPRWIWLNFGVLVFLLFLAKKIIFGGGLRITNRPVLLLILVLVLWMAATSLLGFDSEQSVWGSLFRHQGLVTYVAVLLAMIIVPVVFGESSNKLLWAACISSFVSSLLAFLEIPLLLGSLARVGYGGRLIGPFGQPNFLAEFLSLLLPLQFCLFLNLSGKKKNFVLISIIISAITILGTFSRAGILGLFFGLLLIFLYNWKKIPNKLRLGFLGALVSFIVLLSFSILFLPQVAGQRDRILRELKGIELQTGELPTEQRLPIWISSVALIKQRPFIGWGAENLGDVIVENKASVDKALHAIYVDRAHSFILDLVLNGGFPFLATFLTLTIFVIITGFKKQPFFAISCLVFLAMSTTNIPSITLLVWFFVGLGILSKPITLELSHQNQDLTRNLISAFALGVFVVGFLQFVYYPHRAALAFRRMETGLNVNNFVRAKEDSEKVYSSFPYFKVYEKYYRAFR